MSVEQQICLGRSFDFGTKLSNPTAVDDAALALAQTMLPRLHKYREDRDRIELQIVKAVEEREEAAAALKTLEEDLKAARHDEAELKTKLAKLEKTQHTIEANLEKKTEERKQLESRHKELEKELKTARSVLSDKQSQVKKLETTLSTLMQQKTVAEKTVSTETSRVVKRRDEKNNAQIQLEDHRQKLSMAGLKWLFRLIYWFTHGFVGYTQDLGRLEGDYNSAISAFSDAERDLSKAKSWLEEISGDIKKQSEAMAALDVGSIERQVEKLTTEVAETDSKRHAIDLKPMEHELSKVKEDVERINKEILEIGLTELEGDLKTAKQDLKDAEDEVKTLNKKREDLESIPQVVSGFAHLGYPVIPLPVRPPDQGAESAGVAFLIDPEAEPNKTAKIPDITIDVEEIRNAKMKIEDYDLDQILVHPTKDELSHTGIMAGVYGDERGFLEGVEVLIDLSHQNVPKEYPLPLISNHDELGAYLVGRLTEPHFLSPGAMKFVEAHRKMIAKFEEPRRSLLKLVESADLLKQIDEQVKIVDEVVKARYTGSNDARQSARETGRELIKQLHLNSRLVRYHYVCPKCNVSPEYMKLEHKLSLEQIGDFEALTTEDLIGKLRDYQRKWIEGESGGALGAKMKREISVSWERAYIELNHLQEDCKAAGHESEKNPDPLLKNFHGRRANVLVKIYHELAMDLLLNPRRPWTGSRQAYMSKDSHGDDSFETPNADILLPNTRLTYFPDSVQYTDSSDPVQKPWYCPNCSTWFTQEVADKGSVNKIRHDLLVPVITTLWHEESVHNQTLQLIQATDRQILDRRVDETKDLLATISEFKSDIRELRSGIDHSLASGLAAGKRLTQMAKDFVELGILEQNVADELHQLSDKSKEGTGAVGKIMGDMRKSEDEMQELPRTIALQRETPESPVRQLSGRQTAISLFAMREDEMDEAEASEASLEVLASGGR